MGLVWALLVATSAAFVVTEALKLERPSIRDMQGDRMLSPTCSCRKEAAQLSFRLGKAASVDVAIVDADGEPVRRLASEARLGRGRAVFRWDGRDDSGAVVADGPYRLRVRLPAENRTVTFGQRIAVDTDPPALQLLEVDPRRLIPGDEGLAIHLELDERARVFLAVDGRRADRFGIVERGTEEIVWRGTSRGRALPPGEYEIALRAKDRAGNRSPPTGGVEIVVGPSGG
jgi:hypothetical protein